MLDAEHGKTVGAAVRTQGVHPRRAEVHAARDDTAGRKGRRGPHVAVRADSQQGSRAHTVAVARGKRKKQSLKGMRRRGNKFNSQFRMQNSQLIDSLREFDSTVVILRRSRRIY